MVEGDMALKGKMQAYAQLRATGLAPRDAALQAGYARPGIAVATSRLEARADIKAAIKKLRSGSGRVDDPDPAPEHANDPWKLKDKYATPLDLLLDVVNNPQAPKSLRYQAAKDALPYCHPRKEGGKREEREKKAKEQAKVTKFKPRLVS